MHDTAIDWDFYKEALGDALFELPTSLAAPHPNKLYDDSRNTSEEGFFIPLIGDNFDAHQFVKEVLVNKKTAGAFCQKNKLHFVPANLHEKLVVVEDSLAALQKIAAAWRKKLAGCQVIALTGSSGKTTNKELLGLVLQNFGKTVCPQESFNNEVGVPKTILKATLEDEFLILEFGDRHRHDIKFLTELAKPDIAICLNVGQAHIGEFEGIENTYQTKTDIFRFGNKNSILIANADDEKILSAAKSSDKKVVSFGKSSQAVIKVLSSSCSEKGVATYLFEDKGSSYTNLITVKTKSFHEKMPFNIASTLAACSALSLDLTKAAEKFIEYRPLAGRFSVTQTTNFTLIDDAYNSNPESLVSGVNSLQSNFTKQSKLLVIGDMLELGENSIDLHQEMGLEISRLSKVVGLLTVGDHSSYIGQAFARTYSKPKQVRHYSNIEELMEDFFLTDFNPELVYIKGSNAMNLKKLVTSLASEV